MNSSKKSMIIDTDMALDDWMAILYLLKQSDVDVKAITISGTGIVHRENGITNALNLLALAQMPSIPVAGGLEMPLQGNNQCIKPLRKMMDRMLGITLPPHPHSFPSNKDAVELLKSVIEDSSEKINILSIAPLTNIATFVQKYPELKNRIERIYIMGGAISVKGNIFPAVLNFNNVAELNIYLDPLAASITFSAGIPITLVPLDITNTVPLDMKFYRELKKIKHTTPIAHFIFQALSKFRWGILTKQYYFWDPLATVITHRPELYTTKKISLITVVTPGKYLGQTRADKNGIEVDVVEHVHTEQFKQILLDSYAK